MKTVKELNDESMEDINAIFKSLQHVADAPSHQARIDLLEHNRNLLNILIDYNKEMQEK